jgi:hypothetical protein
LRVSATAVSAWPSCCISPRSMFDWSSRETTGSAFLLVVVELELARLELALESWRPGHGPVACRAREATTCSTLCSSRRPPARPAPARPVRDRVLVGDGDEPALLDRRHRHDARQQRPRASSGVASPALRRGSASAVVCWRGSGDPVQTDRFTAATATFRLWMRRCWVAGTPGSTRSCRPPCPPPSLHVLAERPGGRRVDLDRGAGLVDLGRAEGAEGHGQNNRERGREPEQPVLAQRLQREFGVSAAKDPRGAVGLPCVH